MSVSALSASSQDYVKAIWSLNEWSDAPVSPSVLAAKVGVKLSTTSDAVRKLTEQGYIEHAPYGAISLTELGRAHALQMVRRHRLLETFLVEVLEYRWDQVHAEAENLEHSVSDFMIEQIDKQLGFPERDPHGDPIPRADGTIVMPEARLLSELDTETRVCVERISDDDSQLLQYFADHGIRYGTVIQVRPGSPYSGVVEVVVEGSNEVLPLGNAASNAVWVTPAAQS